MLLLLAWSLWNSGDDPGTTTSNGGSPSQTEETQETESPPAEPTAEDMEAFITNYLATAPEEPETTFEMLTPRFQEESGGIDSYTGFWGTIDSATPVEINADPEALTVAYTVDYVRTDGSETSGDVVLGLVFEDGEYLIDREN